MENKGKRFGAIWMLALLAAAVVAGFLCLNAARISPKPQSRQTTINIATWPGFAPAYLARDRGYFNNLDVKINIIDDFSARQAAFAGGKADFTIYTIDSLAFDVGKGISGQIVMILDRSNGADGLVAGNTVGSIAQLRGEKVAYTRGSPSHFLLYDTLSKAGMKISDIKTVEVDDPTRAAEAFMSGSVAAAVTWEPYLSQIKANRKGVIIADTHDPGSKIIDVLVASDRIVKTDPRLVAQVVAGWAAALDEVKRPKSDTYAIMAKGLGMKEADFRLGAAGVAFADQQMNRTWLTANADGQSPATLLFDEAARLWAAEGLGQAPKPGTAYVNNSFIFNSRQ